MIQLWTRTFCSVVDFAYDLPRVYPVLLKADEQHRKDASAEIMQCVAANMPSYTNADGGMAMIYLLGRYAEPGDLAALDAIKSVQGNIDHQFKDKIFDIRTSPNFPSLKERVLEACQYALANLGDPRSLASFIHDLEQEETRSWRLRLVPKMHERVELLNSMLVLLGDETVLPVGNSEVPPPKTRVCDTAIRALRDWLPDFPVRDRSSAGYYSAESIAEAKIWVAKRILELQEKQLQGDRKPTE